MKQTSIETSVFGTEFVVMKFGPESMCAIKYKLRMMDITISGTSYIYEDNMSVIHNASKTE